MKEREWLACEDPVPMLSHLLHSTTERKLLLFGGGWEIDSHKNLSSSSSFSVQTAQALTEN